MPKDFLDWHALKSRLHENEEPRVHFKEKESEVFWSLPLTTNIRPGHPYQFVFSFRSRPNAVILSQFKLLDAKRLKYKAGFMSSIDFQELKNKIRQLLA